MMFGPVNPMLEILKKQVANLKKPLIIRHYVRFGLKQQPGTPPGDLVHIGKKKVEKVSINLIDYDSKHFIENEVTNLDELVPLTTSKSISWINITGLHDISIIKKMGELFKLHPLLLEDVANTSQRPKLEDYESCLFIVAKMLTFDQETTNIDSEQLSIVIGSNYLITFQENTGDIFDPVRNRIRNSKGKFRSLGTDYLAYTLLDAIVDNYFVLIERIGEKIEDLEEALIQDSKTEYFQVLHAMKREMIFLRRTIWPLREVIGGIQRSESKLVKKSTGIFLRDLYDHTVQVMDTIDTQRDILSGMLDLYMSSMSNRMNDIMKVLTIFAAIFIPLTFVAGVYGMNFSNMPELTWKFGYFYALGFMAAIGFGLLLLFKHKKWI